MQKINIIPQIVFEILKFKNPAIWFVESILAYHLRSRFFADIQFSQNHEANYEASFAAQKVMLPSLKYFAVGPNLSRLPNYLDNKYNFPNYHFVTF